MSNGNLIALVNGDTKGSPPPPTDEFFPVRSNFRANVLDALRLGVAVGIAWAIMFVIITLITAIFRGEGTVLDFFELLYPGLIATLFPGVIIGFALSFVYGFIFGILLGLVYNSLIRGHLLENPSYEINA